MSTAATGRGEMAVRRRDNRAWKHAATILAAGGFAGLLTLLLVLNSLGLYSPIEDEVFQAVRAPWFRSFRLCNLRFILFAGGVCRRMRWACNGQRCWSW